MSSERPRYGIEFTNSAAKELWKLKRKDLRRRLLVAIAALADNPRPSGARKLAGSEAWRIRIGAHRVVYLIEDRKLLVLLVTVADRRDAHR